MEEESKEGFKRCSKCGRVLPLADFNKSKLSKDGLQYYCKDCQKAIKKEWRAKNPTYDAEWYQTHRDSELKMAAEWRAKNPTYNAEWRAKNPTYDAEYYQANKEKKAAYNAEWRAKNPTYDAEYYQSNKEKKAAYNADYSDPQKNPMNWAKRMVNGYRHMDRERFGYDSKTITAEWFLEHIAYQPCAHCGVQGIGLIGCNRLDNTKGHTIDNVEPCCFKCNCKENIRDQLERGLCWFQKGKKVDFKTFVKEHLNEKSKK